MKYNPLNHHFFRIIITMATCLLSPLALASVGSEGSGWSDGFWHPILGFDHLLAMVGVGLLSVQLGKKAIWFVPTAFVAVMLVGGILGFNGIELPQVEGAIALSVFAIGLAIAMSQRMPVIIAMIFVAIFALFHGHAHALEMPNFADAKSFFFGFACATILLHIMGVVTGEICNWTANKEHNRALFGAGICGIGLYILLLTYGLA